ncbi:cyanophycinase [Thalassotalea euphylliae]|uniref:cyanophycinase n=1 Tax=Thalassotalea euphylliae TaxID=1655234 RepID=UPI00363EE9EB
MLPKALKALTFVFILSPIHTLASVNKSQLFLVGGGLKTCSSMSLSQCTDKSFLSDRDKQHPLYRISAMQIEKLADIWPQNHLSRHREKVLSLLAKVQGKQFSGDKNALRAILKKHDKQGVIRQLADREYYLLLDSLEMPVQHNNGERKKEQVKLSQTRNVFNQEIFNKFVALASSKNTNTDKRPNILVVTASARDPYEAVDFYEQVFTQAGANVTWLPIDAAVNRLWQEHGSSPTSCKLLSQYQLSALATTNRAFVYPDRFSTQQTLCKQPDEFVAMIEQADGLFINGGDQSLTKEAFKNKDGRDNAILKAIKTEVTNNSLIVGGTSAGTAVMSGGSDIAVMGETSAKTTPPMITNGRSEVALARGAKADLLPNAGCAKDNQCSETLLQDDLTYNSKGGLSLFPYGVMDTHFSERGRQGRLMKLVQDTNASFGFGVDEATALLVAPLTKDTVEMTVVGQGGVFITEPGNIKNSYITHYLTREDRAKLHNGKLTLAFAPWKNITELASTESQENQQIFEGLRYKQLAQHHCINNEQQYVATSHWQAQHFNITFSQTSAWTRAIGILKTQEVGQVYCSYQNLQVDIK